MLSRILLQAAGRRDPADGLRYDCAAQDAAEVADECFHKVIEREETAARKLVQLRERPSVGRDCARTHADRCIEQHKFCSRARRAQEGDACVQICMVPPADVLVGVGVLRRGGRYVHGVGLVFRVPIENVETCAEYAGAVSWARGVPREKTRDVVYPRRVRHPVIRDEVPRYSYNETTHPEATVLQKEGAEQCAGGCLVGAGGGGPFFEGVGLMSSQCHGVNRCLVWAIG